MESTLQIDSKNTGIPEAKLKALTKRLNKEAATLTAAATAGYKDNYSCLNAVDDAAMLQRSLDMAEKFKGIDLLVVIGIGGSNLGTMAVQEALLGKLHSYTEKPAVLYADTVDAAATKQTLTILEKVLKQKGKVCLNVISKSGTTTETVANAEAFIAKLKDYQKEWEQSIVITTDEGSVLWKLAEKHKLNKLIIPAVIGGRYSVFSSVSTFPLAVLGVDVKSLVTGAAAMRHTGLEPDNVAMRQAASLYLNSRMRRNIAELFVFSTDFESVGKWRRQLYAESLGKNKNRKGRKAIAGITPVVSVGTTDLHSVGQLNLAGPSDKYTTFLSLSTGPSVKATRLSGWEDLVPSIQNKEFSNIMDAIAKGTMTTYKNKRLPFTSIIMERSAYSLGEYFMLEMLTVIYLSALFDVNPFDQPAVEEYKQEARKLLR